MKPSFKRYRPWYLLTLLLSISVCLKATNLPCQFCANSGASSPLGLRFHELEHHLADIGQVLSNSPSDDPHYEAIIGNLVTLYEFGERAYLKYIPTCLSALKARKDNNLNFCINTDVAYEKMLRQTKRHESYYNKYVLKIKPQRRQRGKPRKSVARKVAKAQKLRPLFQVGPRCWLRSNFTLPSFKQYFYHFTSPENLQNILTTRQLLGSANGAYGPGIYCSDVEPGDIVLSKTSHYKPEQHATSRITAHELFLLFYGQTRTYDVNLMQAWIRIDINTMSFFSNKGEVLNVKMHQAMIGVHKNALIIRNGVYLLPEIASLQINLDEELQLGTHYGFLK